MLEPIYATIRYAPRRRPLGSIEGAEALQEEDLVKDWRSFGRLVCPVILRLGLHIHSDVVLFNKVGSQSSHLVANFRSLISLSDVPPLESLYKRRH